jgi:peptidoglycan hydrolase CwlO-like protein
LLLEDLENGQQDY